MVAQQVYLCRAFNQHDGGDVVTLTVRVVDCKVLVCCWICLFSGSKHVEIWTFSNRAALGQNYITIQTLKFCVSNELCLTPQRPRQHCILLCPGLVVCVLAQQVELATLHVFSFVFLAHIDTT